MSEECHLCSAPAPRLYTLPARVMLARPAAGPACYFCFIRVVGIKPTRRLAVHAADLSRAASE